GRKYSTTGDSALGEQASCLLFSLKQAGCLLSQCLERLKATGQNGLFTRMDPDKNSVKTEAGPNVTTRRIAAPKPGLADHQSRVPGKAWMLKVTCQAASR
ncbi:MAG: hypothetical protein PUB53_00455, partial [Bacteroidales bacterium]|nr:hypothetical protein [Bacteroidales bacterium]